MNKNPTYEELLKQVTLLEKENKHLKKCLEKELPSEINKFASIDKNKNLNQNFQVITESMPAVVFFCVNNKDYTMLYLNDTIEKFTGYSKEDFLSEKINIANLFHPDDKIHIYSQINTALKSHTPYKISYRIIHKDGTIRWLEEIGSGIYSPDKKIYIQGFIMDITVREKLETDLLESRENLSITLKSIGDAVITTDEKGKIEIMNPVAEELCGWKVEEAIGEKLNTVFKIFDLEDNLEVKNPEKYINEILKEDVECQAELLSKNGNRYQISQNLSTIRKNNGDLLGSILVFRNLTDEFFMAEALLLNESRMVALMQLIQMTEESTQRFISFALEEGISLTNSEIGFIAFLNDNEDIITIDPWSQKEIERFGIDKNKNEFTINELGLWADPIRKRKPIIINDYSKFSTEDKNLYSQKNINLNCFLGIPVFEGKKIVAFAAVANKRKDYDASDVLQLELLMQIMWKLMLQRKAKEELQLSEERLKLALEGAKEGLWDWDISNGEMYVSKECTQMLGYTEEEIESTYEGWHNLIHQNDIENIREKQKEHLSGKDNYYEVEYRIKTKNNNWKWILAHGRVVERDKNKQPLRAIGTYVDINEQKEIQQKLLIAKEQAEEADRLKSAFLANMSHEIRTPMNGIMGFASLLESEEYDAEIRNEYLGYITQSSKRLLRLIEDIIEISQIEAKQIKLNTNTFSLNQLLSQIHEEFLNVIHEEAKEHIGLMVSKFLTDEDSFIISDDIHLKQVLTHIIDNAIKFTFDGYVEFGYSIKGNFLEFYVKDTGIGLSETEKKFIFERFRQADQLSEGAGLGLTITHKLIELFGGELKVKSEKDKGAIFYFTIPYTPADTLAEIQVTETKANDFDWKGRNILIVEDDYISYSFLKETLKETGVDILYARDGKQAVDLCFNNEKIDIILMDIQLPEMSGYIATEKIKKIREDLPIIAQTAYALKEDKERCFMVGCDDFISKPINISNLLEKINAFF